MKRTNKNVFSTLSRVSQTPLISVKTMSNDKTQDINSPALDKLLEGQRKLKLTDITAPAVKSALKKKELLVIDNLNRSAGLKKLKQTGINSLIVTPFKGKDVEGAVVFYYNKSKHPDSSVMNLMPCISHLASCNLYDESLHERIEQLKKSSNMDGLTGLYNHKYFHEALTKELLRAQRFKYPVSIAMIDIDHFKKYNDTNGHPRGDAVLREIAGILRKSVRSYDIPVRYGGDEFCLILPYAKRNQAVFLLERIRKKVAQYNFYGKSDRGKITISGGVSSYPGNANYKSMLIDRADKALYLAKEEGRNRICTSLGSAKDVINFAFCRPTVTKSPFYSYIIKGMKNVIDDVGNIRLFIEIYEKNLKNRDHIKITKSFIKNKIDAVAISSMAGVDFRLQVEELSRAGIPAFIFNTPSVIPLGKVVNYTGFDHRGAGRKVAKYLIRILRNRGKVAVIEGFPEIASIEMKEGFFEVIKESNVSVVSTECGEWRRIKARDITRKLIKKHPDIDAIWGENDEMALGASDAIKSNGMTGQVFTIGTDGSQAAFEAIKEEHLTATLDTNPVEMGKILMRTVIRNTIKEEKIEPYTWSPINIVDLENVEDSIAKII